MKNEIDWDKVPEDLVEKFQEITEKISKCQKDYEGEQFTGEVVAIGKIGDMIVHVPKIDRSVILSQGWETYKPKIGDKVRIQVTQHDKNLFGICRKVLQRNRVKINGDVTSRKLFDLFGEYTSLEEGKHFSSKTSHINRQGTRKIAVMLGILDPKSVKVSSRK